VSHRVVLARVVISILRGRHSSNSRRLARISLYSLVRLCRFVFSRLDVDWQALIHAPVRAFVRLQVRPMGVGNRLSIRSFSHVPGAPARACCSYLVSVQQALVLPLVRAYHLCPTRMVKVVRRARQRLCA
jgi:hypothetical protein